MRSPVENFITHNGDFDAFQVNRKWNDQGAVNLWLESALKYKPPSVVDSASIAGVVDLIRAQGCFALAARFSVGFMLRTSDVFPDAPIPTLAQFEEIGKHFEKVLDETLAASNGQFTVQELGFNLEMREKITKEVVEEFEKGTNKDSLKCLDNYLDEEVGAPIREFVRFTVHAFFDNDSLFTTKYFFDARERELWISDYVFVGCAQAIVCRGERANNERSLLSQKRFNLLWKRASRCESWIVRGNAERRHFGQRTRRRVWRR